MWRWINGYEGLYEVSSEGRLRSHRYSPNVKTLTGYKDRSGYIQVCIGGKKRWLHRLIAETFLKQRVGCDVVNHKNGMKHDNCVSNLEWVTTKENVRHSIDVLGNLPFGGKRLDFYGSDHGMSKLDEKDVKKIRRMYVTGGHTHRSLAKEYNVAPPTITAILNYRTWTHV